MKNKVKLLLHPLGLSVAVLWASFATAWAQNPIKGNTTSMATNTSINWLLGGVGTASIPAPNQIGEFDSTVSAANLAHLTLGGETVVMAGLQFDTNIAGSVTIADTSALYLGNSCINMGNVGPAPM